MQNKEGQNEFTLEKMKLNERLGNLEVTMGKVLQSVDQLKDQKNEAHSHMSSEMNDFRRVLYGHEEHPGVLVQLDRLNRDHESRRVHLTILYTVLIGLVVNQAYRVLLAHG